MVASGRLNGISGRVPLDTLGRRVGGDTAAQFRQVLRNIGTALWAAGADWRGVIALTGTVHRCEPGCDLSYGERRAVVGVFGGGDRHGGSQRSGT